MGTREVLCSAFISSVLNADALELNVIFLKLGVGGESGAKDKNDKELPVKGVCSSLVDGPHLAFP